MMSRSATFPALLAAAIALGVFLVPAESLAAWTGKAVPAFSATDLQGREVRLADLLGRSKVLVVNFWGVRCQTCIEEMPYLAAMAEKLGPLGVVVVGVNADGLPKEKILDLLPKIGIRPSYPLVCDPEFKVMDAFGVTATPLTILVLPDGKAAYEHLGFSPGEEQGIEAEIRKLLETGKR